MKRAIIIIVMLILLFTAVACNKQQVQNTAPATDKVESTPTQKLTQKPTYTPVPLLKPDKVMVHFNSIFKIYDNGEHGWIGYSSIDDRIKNYEESYVKRKIEEETVKADIPVIVERTWDYDRITEDGHKAILKSSVDKEDYDAKYGKQLDEIKSKYNMGEPYTLQSFINFDKCGRQFAYLIDTDKSEGAVFVHFDYFSDEGEYYDYSNSDIFKDYIIKDVAIGQYHVVGLTDSGEVLSYIIDDEDILESFDDFKHGQDKVTQWRDIVDVAAGAYHTIALKKDGTVIASGLNDDKQCDVLSWTDIVAIEAGNYSSFGIKSDGSVVVAGGVEGVEYNAQNWKDISHLVTGNNVVAGINKVGEVYVTGSSLHKDDAWDNSDKPIFSDVVSVDFVNDTMVVLDSKGEVDFATVYDYMFNYKDYTTDIDDITAVGEYSFAFKKGNEILFSSSNDKGDDWNKLLNNSKKYTPPPYYKQIMKIELTDDGDLLFKEQQNDKREAVFDYEKKIVDYKVVFDIFELYVVAQTEDSDVLYLDYEYHDLSFNHEVIFDSEKENAKIKKIYSNPFVLVILDDKGNVHYPEKIKYNINQNYKNINWDERYNWYKDTENAPSNAKQEVKKEQEYIFEDLASWDDFAELFDGDLPEFTEGKDGSFYKVIYDDRTIVYAWFDKCSIEIFDDYVDLLIATSFDLQREYDSVRRDVNKKEYPLIVKELKCINTDKVLELHITDDPKFYDISISFTLD